MTASAPKRRTHSGERGLNFAEDLAKNDTLWVTPILGSGWSSRAQRKASAARILQALALALGQQRDSSDLTALLKKTSSTGEDWSTEVLRFATELVNGHLAVEDVTPNVEASEGEQGNHDPITDSWIISILLAATMMTELLDLSRACGPPMPRFAHPRLSRAGVPKSILSLWATAQARDEFANLLNLLQAFIDQTDVGWTKPFGGDGFAKSMLTVLKEVKSELQELRVTESRLRMVTDLAWFSLTAYSDLYPRWSDLLLDLSNKDESPPPGLPRFAEIGQANRFIRDRYMGLTHTAANRYKEGQEEGDEAASLHAAVADLLIAQSARVNHAQKSPPTPLPVAFVTSFDVELELALLAKEVAFSVVFPVFVTTGDGDMDHNQVALRWCIAREITVSQEDDRAELTANKVCLATDDAVKLLAVGNETGFAGPIIIRLTGFPLLSLEGHGLDPLKVEIAQLLLNTNLSHLRQDLGIDYSRLQDSFKKWLSGNKDVDLFNNILKINHAVIISEFDAGIHNAFDQVPVPDFPSGANPDATRLPRDAVAGAGHRHRLWTLLGVQLGDTAVRQRLTHVAWYGRLAPSRSAPALGWGSTSGLAISHSIQEPELELLNWMGFSHIKVDVTEAVAFIACATQFIESNVEQDPEHPNA